MTEDFLNRVLENEGQAGINNFWDYWDEYSDYYVDEEE